MPSPNLTIDQQTAEPHRVDPGAADVVLVVVDMQNGFLTKHSEQIVAPVKALVERWVKAGGQTVFTRFFNRPGSPYQRLIGWFRLQQPPETDLCPSLQPFAKTVIDKDYYTPFSAGLDDLIAKHGWKILVICGVATDGCVLKTAVDAFERGLLPIVVRDACASHAGQEIHQMGITLLERFIGRRQVVNAEMLPTT